MKKHLLFILPFIGTKHAYALAVCLKSNHFTEKEGLSGRIPGGIKEKITQPFFTTKPTGEGTGLGLSLTYDMVVKGHGGSIQVNSVEGEGSEFIIGIPII
jgi:nitrogen-specific signal transduction histidine kinase